MIVFREAVNFITHLKTRIWDNSDHLNVLKETIKQIGNAFEAEPFLMDGLISAVGDDQSSTDSDLSSSNSGQSSSDSDQSSTQCPNDREEAKDRNPDTTMTIKIKDWFETIIALLLNWGGDGGGDSSPGIPNLGKWRILNSFISGWINLYSYIDCIPGWLLYTLYGILTIFRVYSLNSWSLKMYKMDIRWMLPSFTMFRFPYNGAEVKDVIPLKEWTNPPHFNNWIIVFQKAYGINHLKQIRRSLGLRLIRGHAISMCFLAKAFADRGLRTCIAGDIVTALTRVSTRTYDPISNKYIHYFFHILVYMGVGVVVWYQILPAAGLGAPCPTGFDTEILPAFRDPTSIVEGYRKVTYLFTKDITPTVIQTYKNYILLEELLCIDIQEDVFPSVEGRHRLLSFGTALMMAVFLTTKTLALPA